MLPVLILVLTIAFIYWKITRIYSTWTDRGIKQTNPPYLLGDNAGSILRHQSIYDTIKNIYNYFPEERYVGTYQTVLPVLFIRDPELVKELTIKDFDHFHNHRQFVPDDVEPMWSKNLFSMNDMEWKQMRTTLTPSFTSSKMKNIFKLISECCDIHVKYYQKDGTRSVELKDMTVRYTNDVIASVAFGIKCDSVNDKNNEFFTMAKGINSFLWWRSVAFLTATLFPTLFKALRLKIFPRKTTKFFIDVVKNTIRIREEQGIIRPDMIHLLMETRKENSLKLEFSDEYMAAQAFIFFLGGFETVSATLYFMGHSLATHPDIQRKLQDEIDQTMEKCGGELTYEALLKMTYLDMVVSETLRKWPSLPAIDRICTKTYELPPNNEKGEPVKIYPGESISIPTIAFHYDPKYFPDPERFDPERFSEKNKNKINPYTYLPFGVGPRNCIGSRLALLEIKVFYFYFLLNFDFVRTEKTENPLVLHKSSFGMTTENDIWVAMKPRQK